MRKLLHPLTAPNLPHERLAAFFLSPQLTITTKHNRSNRRYAIMAPSKLFMLVIVTSSMLSLCEPFTIFPSSRPFISPLSLRSSLLDDMPTINTDLLSEKDKSMLDALRSRSLNDDDSSSVESMTLLPASRDLPPLPTTFNPEYLAAVFGPRPLTCLTRVLQIGSTLAPVLPSILFAAAKGDLDTPATQAALASKFREALTTLGPFFIKAGQALSIRPDVLPPPAMVEMQRLCDKVPSYSSDLAFKILEEELGGKKEEFYNEITAEPVAAASLGQVYKATLKDGGSEVAVKVQRPEVLETVSLDLHLVRTFGLFLRALNPSGGVDVVSLLDEFGGRFYDELDYVKEVRGVVWEERSATTLKHLQRSPHTISNVAKTPSLRTRRSATTAFGFTRTLRTPKTSRSPSLTNGCARGASTRPSGAKGRNSASRRRRTWVPSLTWVSRFIWRCC